MRMLAWMLLLCCFLPRPARAQQAAQTAAPQAAPTLPRVTSLKCPVYPPRAEDLRFAGTVRLQVTTDGHKVAAVRVISGFDLLADAAEKNVLTWKFADHTPTTFMVVFEYVHEGYIKRDPVTKCHARMELPTKVTVSTTVFLP